jgi:hypothetical protein
MVPTERPVSFEISSNEFPSARRSWTAAISTATALRPSLRPLERATRFPGSLLHPRGYKAALQLGHNTQDRENHPSGRGGGIERFGQKNELDVECRESVQGPEQVRNGTGEAVELPHCDDIEAPLWASAIRRFISGRESLDPDTPTSTYSPATIHPRRWQYSHNSRSCNSGDCPFPAVETRA